MLAVALAVTLLGTGCGAKSEDAVVTQKETTVSTKDKKAEDKKDTKESAKESTDKQEQTEQQETEVNAEETEDTQETVVADSKADTVNSSSNNETNSSSKNKENNNSTNKPSANNTATSTNGRTTTTNTGSNTTTSTATNTNNSTGSNSNNSTQISIPTPAQHQHTWVHVEATGHNEIVVVQAAWDEQVPVYDDVAHDICNQCGADITDNASAHNKAHALEGGTGGWHTEWRYEQTGTQTIHHEAVTEQRWVQDASAYDVCSGCGVTR